ncbi:LOW QUALITY PROTEIN: loganic acid O-methyltransferase [Jatropha curcas]|uniref:LOW QUALITY PROTEIN: loganic acid O-methyltransferase n=1 Tax=Jatropha curcas TaxID=180498 RepID=UPI00189482BD|nr:LOW QUALITY PROTEIN: loganic acid O-methyltransferase [Jatropha curcas]
MTTIANLTIPHFREVIDNARSLIDEAIARNLNINDLIFGPSMKYKCQSQGLASPIPEFQVFFNDHVLNDFNTLFRSLPPKRGYFAAGVPGSFLGRLFSRSSLHLMHTSTSLHWLSQSQMPEEILNNHSPVWNKGRIFYTNASDEVCKAYATQFEKDMEIFLDARAKELVVGGIILIMVPTIHDGISHSCEYFNVSFDILGSSLMDMAREGLVREVQVESFNLPFYIPSAKEVTELVKRNSCFIIERTELFKAFSEMLMAESCMCNEWRRWRLQLCNSAIANSSFRCVREAIDNAKRLKL